MGDYRLNQRPFRNYHDYDECIYINIEYQILCCTLLVNQLPILSYTMDASDFSLPTASGSRLLSDSPLVLPSHSLSFSNTGPGGDDLSLSELSIADRTSSIFSKPFTLLAEPSPPEKPADTSGNGSSNAAPEETAEVDKRSRRQVDEKQREEKLRSDLFILKKLNSAFSLFHEALDESGSANKVRRAFLVSSSPLARYRR